jgi:plasmid stabilization system protein ParE
MAYKISWTDIALEDYYAIINYLLDKWSLKVAFDFQDIVNKKLNDLSRHPFVGIKSDKIPSVRSILFTKHNRLYYRITENNIELLTIIDTRRDPEKKSF